ncbi:MAG: methyltransferase domain-containing protein [Mesorhizobium sp.]
MASDRIASFVAALPIRPDMRILEIGCGPGVAARLIAARLESGIIVAIDRSARAVEQACAGSVAEIASGRMEVRQSAIEDFELQKGEAGFDLIFGMRIGVLDGRHPHLQEKALGQIALAARSGARLFIDGGDPLEEIILTGGKQAVLRG